jgi:hypothetical protein
MFNILTATLNLAVWKPVALWTVTREKNSQQISGLYLCSLYYVFQPYISFVFLLSLNVSMENFCPVLGQKVLHNQAQKHAGRKLEGTS